MSSRTIQHFRQYGLTEPIRAKPGIWSWLFFVFGGLFLVGGSLFALVDGGPFEFLVGLIGLPFFGFGFYVYFNVLSRSGERGMLEFSKQGIYHGLYNIDIPWSDIGPAWIYSIQIGMTNNSDVLFILRNAPKYKAQLGGVERFLFMLMERQGRSQSGGALDMGVKAFGMVFGEADAGSDTVNALQEMRNRLKNDPNSAVLGIPRITRFGLSNDDTVEIINTMVMQQAAK
ncbi:MAG: hypothetical protein P8Y67_09520 [Alphaproteobacteria bacterium]